MSDTLSELIQKAATTPQLMRPYPVGSLWGRRAKSTMQLYQVFQVFADDNDEVMAFRYDAKGVELILLQPSFLKAVGYEQLDRDEFFQKFAEIHEIARQEAVEKRYGAGSYAEPLFSSVRNRC